MTPSQTERSSGLNTEQLEFWDKNGYLIIPDALSPTITSSLLNEAHSMLTSFPLETHPMTKFSTGQSGNAHVGDDYFLTSGDKIRFFFEADAFSHQDDGGSKLTRPKERAINKIGHCLHGLSPPFRDVTMSRVNADVARDLGFRDPRCLQSMVICKQPEIGGAVDAHQDSTFLYTDPPSAVGFWYALQDATVANGCLSFVAGSHKRAPVTQRLVRSPEGKGTEFADNDGGLFPKNMNVGNVRETLEEEEVYTIGEVKAGTLVLIHGNLLHKSEMNTSQIGRMVYTFHVIEGCNEYDGRNWLQPPKEGFAKLAP